MTRDAMQDPIERRLRPYILILVLLLPVCAAARDDDILFVKRVSASRIDTALPDEGFEIWLGSVLGPGVGMEWEGSNDCGEGGDRPAPLPICVDVEARLGDCGRVLVRISVGRTDSEVTRDPEVFWIEIAGLGPSISVGNLTELPTRLEEARRASRRLQAAPVDPIDEAAAIAYAKQLEVQQLAEGLPARSLAQWFEELAGPGSAISWNLEGCDRRVPDHVDPDGCDDYAACASVFCQIVPGVDRTALVRASRRVTLGGASATIAPSTVYRRGEAMSNTARFGAYAAAFEKAYASDDWSLVEPFFTEDAIYEVALGPPLGGCFEGRAAILAYFKDSLDRFDRRFESRDLALLEGPKEDGGSVWIRGSATYRAKGVPEFVLELEETAHFKDNRIHRLEDRYDSAMQQRISTYLNEHGAKLGISIDG